MVFDHLYGSYSSSFLGGRAVHFSPYSIHGKNLLEVKIGNILTRW